MIRAFLQITDQWLRVQQWILPFSLCLFSSYLCSPLGAIMFSEGNCVTDTSPRGGRPNGWLVDHHPPGGLTWTTHRNTYSLYRPSCFSPFLSQYSVIVILQVCYMKSEPVNNIRRLALPPESYSCLMHHWHVGPSVTTLRALINQSF